LYKHLGYSHSALRSNRSQEKDMQWRFYKDELEQELLRRELPLERTKQKKQEFSDRDIVLETDSVVGLTTA